jgi:hypothetical protein
MSWQVAPRVWDAETNVLCDSLDQALNNDVGGRQGSQLTSLQKMELLPPPLHCFRSCYWKKQSVQSVTLQLCQFIYFGRWIVSGIWLGLL